MIMGNYDPTRKRQNFEVVRGGRIRPVEKCSISRHMADLLRLRGRSFPNDGLTESKYRTVLNFIFGDSRERIQEGSQAVNYDKGVGNSDIARKPVF